MALSLPPPISTYFALSNGAQAIPITQCFTADAVVVDEAQTHCGHDAIRAWKHAARRKFDYSVEPVEATRDDDRWTVTANVVGNFPGSPVRLDHVFALAGDAIRSLEIR